MTTSKTTPSELIGQSPIDCNIDAQIQGKWEGIWFCKCKAYCEKHEPYYCQANAQPKCWTICRRQCDHCKLIQNKKEEET